ncbi:MAG: hypothetical protein KGO82_17195 [Bacteroidota bacterium]|nr:hypothetical protein [Bacteroidota bacterium]
MELTGKTILILSPQCWGKMLISKHHYAISLAKRGNQVYFLNPPNDPLPSGRKVQVKPSGLHENLLIIDQALYFPYNLKFHALPVFHYLMKRQIKKILQAIGRPVDIAWSFDIGHFYPFRHFSQSILKIFHPVDEPLSPISIAAAEGADIIFSVTNEILDKYAHLSTPRYFINHGLTNEFLGSSVQEKAADIKTVRAGFSGNLLRNDIDREAMLQIIRENGEVVFECWGSYKVGDSNIGGSENREQVAFIRELQQCSNVVLHGAVGTKELAAGFRNIDIFLICYDVQKDQSRGTNYHKVMEYLSTGKVIVSNNITTYRDQPELVSMVSDRQSNGHLPALFREVAGNLVSWNSLPLQEKRVAYARDNTYEKQVDRIENILLAYRKGKSRLESNAKA